ncbi:MAG TPA: hypothetical protein VGE76_14215, partial [Opitutaceae bacterium]
DNTVSASTSYTYRVRAFNGSAASAFSNVATITTPSSSTPPTVWQSVDIGAVGVAGSDNAGGTAISVSGSGSDVWDNADAFRFLYQTRQGDCVIEARVASLTNTHGWAKAGVMIRESLAPGARNVFALLTPSNGAHVQVRSATGGATTDTAGPWGIAVPYWVRLARSGNVITASISADGITWSTVSSTTLTLGSQIYVGFAVTSHDNSALSTAVFSDPFIQ